jgi:hypothetical protein
VIHTTEAVRCANPRCGTEIEPGGPAWPADTDPEALFCTACRIYAITQAERNGQLIAFPRRAAWRARLDSPEYRELHRLLYAMSEGACWCCGHKNVHLAIHHTNYEHIGHELPGRDVILVCRSCHAKLHEISAAALAA